MLLKFIQFFAVFKLEKQAIGFCSESDFLHSLAWILFMWPEPKCSLRQGANAAIIPLTPVNHPVHTEPLFRKGGGEGPFPSQQQQEQQPSPGVLEEEVEKRVPLRHQSPLPHFSARLAAAN